MRQWLTALALVSAFGCRKPGDSHVTLVYEADSLAPALTNVSIIVGSDPMDIDALKPGEAAGKIFRTSDMEQGIIVMAQHGNRRLIWDTDWSMQPGVGYTVRIEIDAVGKVTERHCTRPCSLD